MAWLHESPTDAENPTEKEHMIWASKLFIYYADDAATPSIEDTSIVSESIHWIQAD